VDARAWDERYEATDLMWSVTPNQFVAAALAGLPPERALDLACGEGRNAIWLASLGWQVTALDFSAVAVEKGRARAGEVEVNWVVGDVLTDPLPEVDLVVLAYLQLPAEERSTAVRRAFGSLSVGGTFFLVAHDSTNLTEGTGGPTDPAFLYTAEEVLADLDGERYEVVAAERVAREIPPAGTHQHTGAPSSTAYDALVHLVRTPGSGQDSGQKLQV
jgi:SAM-dependent methyltransferase